MVLECLPQKKRGFSTCIFGLALSIGVCFSFSLGKIFGESLDKYWKILMIIPPAWCIFRSLIIFCFFNHDTPRQLVMSNENIHNGIIEAEKVMKLYYDNCYEIELAKEVHMKLILNRRAQENLEEKKWCCHETLALFKDGFMNRKTMYSTMAVFSFDIFPQVAGQVFTDNYTKEVFEKLNMPHTGAEVNFYCGFAVLFAAILALSL